MRLRFPVVSPIHNPTSSNLENTSYSPTIDSFETTDSTDALDHAIAADVDIDSLPWFEMAEQSHWVQDQELQNDPDTHLDRSRQAKLLHEKKDTLKPKHRHALGLHYGIEAYVDDLNLSEDIKEAMANNDLSRNAIGRTIGYSGSYASSLLDQGRWRLRLSLFDRQYKETRNPNQLVRPYHNLESLMELQANTNNEMSEFLEAILPTLAQTGMSPSKIKKLKEVTNLNIQPNTESEFLNDESFALVKQSFAILDCLSDVIDFLSHVDCSNDPEKKSLVDQTIKTMRIPVYGFTNSSSGNGYFISNIVQWIQIRGWTISTDAIWSTDQYSRSSIWTTLTDVRTRFVDLEPMPKHISRG